MSEPHERLDQAMEARRLDLRLSWAQLARDADISPQALRAIRRGEYRPSKLTARDLDDALKWQRGSVETVLAGGEPEQLRLAGELPALTEQIIGAVLDEEALAGKDREFKARFERIAADRRERRALEAAMRAIEEQRDAG
ncbi:helix-turn-helix transcriptional regulator [Actinocorallia longicatena]|uniref:HTH cro/C1-type domain-containing protein n=1 Tax=Actinocorallia longicatena TaxID=111803 RepID=A0ABP6QEH0_9ACTN